MKTGLSFFLLLAFSLNAFSQTWCPANAIWHHSWTTIAPVNGYLKMEYTHDTLIQLTNCKVLEKTFYGYDFFSQQFFSQGKGNEYTYESNAVVFVFDPVQSNLDTLFNLNAAPGDYWSMAKTTQVPGCDNYGRVTVQDTGSRVLNGVNLKWLKVINEYDAPGGLYYVDTIFEKIGGTHWYFLPYQYCESTFDQEGGAAFRCYSDSLFLVYNNSSNACDFTVGLSEHDDPFTDFKLFPNPTDEYLNFQPPYSNVNYAFFIFNSIGEIVQVGNFNTSFSLNILNWKNGIYYILITNNVKQWNQKIVKLK